MQYIKINLKEVKQTIQDGLQMDHDDESKQQGQFEQEVKDKGDENKTFSREIIVSEGEVTTTEDSIEEKEGFLTIRADDLASFEEDFARQNSNFEADTDAYEDIRNELVRESSVASDTLALISNAGFASYLNN